MPVNANNTQGTQQPTQGRPASRSDSAKVREGFNKVATAASRTSATRPSVRSTSRSARSPVTDRVSDIVEPFTTRQTANRELKSIRTRAERELNRLERRGATARRKTRTRVRRTRNRVERELNRRRRNVQAAVKQNRDRAENREAGSERGLRSGSPRWSNRLTRAVSRGDGLGEICPLGGGATRTRRAEQQPLLPEPTGPQGRSVLFGGEGHDDPFDRHRRVCAAMPDLTSSMPTAVAPDLAALRR